MRNIRFLLILFLFLVLPAAHKHAIAENPGSGFRDTCMTDAEGSTEWVKTFAWEETPWLYLRLPECGMNVEGTWWTNPKERYSFTASDLDNDGMIWYQLENWDSRKSLGPWHVHISEYSTTPAVLALSRGGKGFSGQSAVNFTVTPEPLSAILYVCGGIFLGILRRMRSAWRKK